MKRPEYTAGVVSIYRKYIDRYMESDGKNVKIEKKDIQDFERLQYKNKLLISDKNEYKSRFVITHPILRKKNYRNGKILEYPMQISKKRYMDSIDYVGFLNQPN